MKDLKIINLQLTVISQRLAQILILSLAKTKDKKVLKTIDEMEIEIRIISDSLLKLISKL